MWMDDRGWQSTTIIMIIQNTLIFIDFVLFSMAVVFAVLILWSSTLVQTEISKWLSDRSLWDFVQTWMFPRWRIWHFFQYHCEICGCDVLSWTGWIVIKTGTDIHASLGMNRTSLSIFWYFIFCHHFNLSYIFGLWPNTNKSNIPIIC